MMTREVVVIDGDKRSVLQLCSMQGTVSIVGELVDRTALETSTSSVVNAAELRNRKERDHGDQHHITLISKNEMNFVLAELGTDAYSRVLDVFESEMKSEHWLSMGLGQQVDKREGNVAYFVVLLWPCIQIARKQFRLPPTDLHITVGFKGGDVHNVHKGTRSLIRSCSNIREKMEEMFPVIQGWIRRDESEHSIAATLALTFMIENLEKDGDDDGSLKPLRCRCLSLRSAALGQQKRFDEALLDGERWVELEPRNPSAYARAAAASVALCDYENALAFSQQGLKCVEDGNHSSVVEYLKKISDKCTSKIQQSQSEHPTPKNDDDDDDNDESNVPKIRFPRTHHILAMGGGQSVSRDDLVMDKADGQRFYGPVAATVICEEKVDGANLGLSMRKDGKVLAQNRSHFVNSASHSQFKSLDMWISQNYDDLHAILSDQKYILFGEWMYAQHSIHYTALPSYFLAFDLYDVKKQKFLSVDCRNQILKDRNIPVVPTLFRGQLRSKKELEDLLNSQSAFREGFVEGVYVRVDEDETTRATTRKTTRKGPAAAAAVVIDAEDEKEGEGTVNIRYNILRGKVVREDFIQGIGEHWMTQTLTKNKLKF